ncbi:MAG: hypothetical protein ACTHKR_14830, partial [Sphingomonas sp.]
TYSTFNLNNYSSIPAKVDLTNSKGSKIFPADANFKNLGACLKGIGEYRVILNSTKVKPIFLTKDGATIGGIARLADLPGALVFVPYFYFDLERFAYQDDAGELAWNSAALDASRALIGQLIAVDKMLRSGDGATPPPDWIAEVKIPDVVSNANDAIKNLDEQIDRLQCERTAAEGRRVKLLQYSHLLYESGKPLERVVEKALQLLGFSAEGLDTGELEIDHVILSPSGKRLIGESEGKDNSAIDITKFRQLESNIGEDFQRDEVVEPAKGVLFGNGFRLTKPQDRSEQFTQKSLTNAKRLGSALVRTTDLYDVITYLLDHPDDESFKSNCREAIESELGGIVEFPRPT